MYLRCEPTGGSQADSTASTSVSTHDCVMVPGKAAKSNGDAFTVHQGRQ